MVMCSAAGEAKLQSRDLILIVCVNEQLVATDGAAAELAAVSSVITGLDGLK